METIFTGTTVFRVVEILMRVNLLYRGKPCFDMTSLLSSSVVSLGT